jgi:hypothetical protein
MEFVDTGAVFSDCGKFRYELWRTWKPELPFLTMLMLNPSTADAERLDPTVTRVMNFALREGCGGFIVYNIFALRSTDPKALYSMEDPVGPANNQYIQDALAADEHMFIAGWGNHGNLNGRSEEVREMMRGYDVKCLGLTGKGEPKHPLYLRADTPLVSYVSAAVDLPGISIHSR